MPQNITIVLCEGLHDIAFLYRVLKTQGFTVFSEKIKNFPNPLDSFLIKEISATNIEELKIEEIRNRLIPSEPMHRGNNLLLFYSIGSDSKTAIRQGLIKTFKAIVPSDPEALAVLKDTTISILYFLDADTKGINARLGEVNAELQLLHGGNEITNIVANGDVVTMENIKYGAFIFSIPTSENGRLEDYVIPLMKKDNEDIFEQAEAFIQIHEQTKLFSGVLTKDAGGILKKVSGEKFDFNKSLVGTVGQLQKSGKSNVVCIRESDYINDAKIGESVSCKAIIDFINKVMI